ncbi:MAG: hypothetical protein RL625_1474 [Gemmatimonadota bacterium]|jgi:hypothetical protein
MGDLHQHHETSRPLTLRSFAAVLQELDRLERAHDAVRTPGWDVPHTLDHCARSITHSLQGFPVLKPAVFRATVGPMVFRVFDAMGQMRHDLLQEIPGDAPPPIRSLGDALTILRERIHTFDRWDGPLQPHFAYGRLTKAQYERAHCMHVANHLASWHYAI